MAQILFISEQKIKDETAIDENVDAKILRNVILEAQDMHILPLLGTGLYNDIKDEIDAGSVSSDNATLLDDYVQPALKWWVMVEGLDVMNYKFLNKGIVQQSGSETYNPSLQDIVRLMDRFRDKAQWYDTRLIAYLCANESTYPLYTNPGTDSDTIHPRRSSYDHGIYLGGRRGSAPTSTESGQTIVDSDFRHLWMLSSGK